MRKRHASQYANFGSLPVAIVVYKGLKLVVYRMLTRLKLLGS